MIKKRFGEDFHTKIAERLEVKAAVDHTKKDYKKKRNNNREGGKDNRERKPRAERKEGEKPVDAETTPAADQPKGDKPVDKEAPKRDGRRRGPREGQ